MALANLP